MRAWLGFLTRGRLLELALAVALGSAVLTVFDNVSETMTSVLAQQIGRNPSGENGSALGLVNLFSAPYYLYVKVGDTFIVYGGALSALLTLGLVGVVGWLVVRLRDAALGECHFCASRIPHESTHCAYCGSALESEGPEPPATLG